MSHQSIALNAPEVWEDMKPGMPFMHRRHRDALERLAKAFDSHEPLTMLVGGEKSETGHLLRCFLAGLEDDVTVACIGKPYEFAKDGLGELVRNIGFDPKDLAMSDLEHILRMFLSFQKGRQHRTIFGIEQAQDQGPWLIDAVQRLIDFEEENKAGLMIVLSGSPSINELVDESPLANIRDRARQRIALEPFTLGETREYIRRRSEDDVSADVDDAFDFQAVTLIHELCMGAPDKVGAMYSACVELARSQDAFPVTTGIVMEADRVRRESEPPRANGGVNGSGNRAANGAASGAASGAARCEAEISLDGAANVALLDADDDAVEIEEDAGGMEVVEDRFSHVARLFICHKSQVPQEYPLGRGRTLLGRAAVCDVRLFDDLVSRHHALIIKSSQGVKLLDLGSTNGTVVDGRKIRDHTLEDGQLIKIGRYRIEYRAAKSD